MLPDCIREATRWAHASTAPEEMPAKIPSRSVSSRVASTASLLWIIIRPFSTDWSRTGGM